MRLKVSSAKRRPFYLGLNVFTHCGLGHFKVDGLSVLEKYQMYHVVSAKQSVLCMDFPMVLQWTTVKCL